MIVGLGTHIIELAELKAALDRNGESLVRRMLTAGEFSTWQYQRDPLAHLAQIQAVKEAVVLALGTKMGQGVGYRDIEVNLDGPTVLLHGGAQVRQQRCTANQWLISCSMSRQFVTATALAQP